MNDTNHRKQIYHVNATFRAACLIEYAAPYGDSQEVSLPVGMVITAYQHDDAKDLDYIDARVIHADDWAPFIIRNTYRFSRHYCGYSLSIKLADLQTYCSPLDQLPDVLPEPVKHHQAIQGCLFGTAVGDAIGLPYEGLSPRRIDRLHAFPLKHRFFFGIGMLSDDTEHSCLVAQSLIASRGDPSAFSRALAWRLRWWFLGLPAGIGLATLKACIKLWLGFPAKYSGVYSAGNGPGMRSAIIGVFTANNPELRLPLITANTLITHRDPKALRGALVIAELAARSAIGNPLSTTNALSELSSLIGDDDELGQCLTGAIESATRQQSAREYCAQSGQNKGVSGYIYHTLPVVLQIVLRHPGNFEAAISEAISCGGDTDTVAAIVGGIVGTRTGIYGIPPAWLKGVRDWPRTQRFIRLLGEELAVTCIMKQPARNQTLDIIRVWMRNLPFMLWVLAHGFRRLLPPY